MSSADSPAARRFRLPPSTYVVVLFLLFGAVPLAFGGVTGSAVYGWRNLIMGVPVLAAVYIARVATFVDAEGVHVRAFIGSRSLPWDEIRGLALRGNRVYAMSEDGALRLPCVRVSNLHQVAEASGGRLPEVAAPTPKFAPQKRRR